jgi:putative FmdB family regulatory protein
MPIYEYECKDCSHCFEVLLLFSSDPPPQCPECQCKDVVKLLSSGTMRKREEYTGAGGILDPFVGPTFSGNVAKGK